MSEFTNNYIGRDVASLDASPEFDGYSGVEIVVSEELSYFAGSLAGRVLTIENEWGTQAMAENILEAVRGFQYQPFRASGAIVNPAAELGDAVTISDMYSGIYKMSRSYNSLMAADIEAPADEELDHEYPFEASQDRVYKREIANNRAQISLTNDRITSEVTRASAAEGSLSSRITQTASKITQEVTRASAAEGSLSSRITQTANEITSEVTRATQAEGTLSSRITQTADSISQEVTRATQAEGTLQSSIQQTADAITAKVSTKGGKYTEFGWSLTDSEWTIFAGGLKVLKATAGELYIDARINARQGGKIGGFTIGSDEIYKNISDYTDEETTSGVYVGTRGIRLGKNFKVSQQGAVTARNISIVGGSIKLGNDSDPERFKVTTTGTVTAKALSIIGGSIKLGGTEADPVFWVKSSGAVIAKSLTLKGGSIQIGGTDADPVFKVTTAGKVTAKSLTLKGGSIQIGGTDEAPVFKVTSTGDVTANKLTAKDAKLTGTLQIGGINITADALRSGAQTAYNRSSYWEDGAGYGHGYGKATAPNPDEYPNFFTCDSIYAKTTLTTTSLSASGNVFLSGNTYISTLYVGAVQAQWRTVSIDGAAYNVLAQL